MAVLLEDLMRRYLGLFSPNTFDESLFDQMGQKEALFKKHTINILYPALYKLLVAIFVTSKSFSAQSRPSSRLIF